MNRHRLKDGHDLYASLAAELRAAKVEPFKTEPIPETGSSTWRHEKIHIPELELEWAQDDATGDFDFYLIRGNERWPLSTAPEDLRLRLYESIADTIVRRKLEK